MLITFFQALSQPYPQKLWDKRIGGFGGDQAKSNPLKISKDGNLLFTAESTGGPNGDLSTPSWGSSDYWLFKTDTLGNIIWEKGFGGYSSDFVRDFIELDDGGFVLAGFTSSGIGGDKTQASRGSYDVWIVRLDSSRNILWDRTLGGSYDDQCWSICQTVSGGFMLAGSTGSPLGFEVSQMPFSPGNFNDDFWVVCLDSLGNKIWDNRYGWTSTDIAYKILQTSDGNYLVVGTTDSHIGGSISQPSNGSTDFWVLKIDSLGNKLWDKRYGSIESEIYNNTTLLTSDGGFIIGGASDGPISGDKSEMLRGSYDFWVIKCDSLGNKQWDKTLGGDKEEGLGDICLTSDGGYMIIGGSLSQATGDKTQANWPGSVASMWLVKIRSNGTKQWDVRWGGNNIEGGEEIIEISPNSFVAYGSSWSNASFDKSQNNWSATPTSNPSGDLWLLTFTEPPLGYENMGDSKGGLDVFPNPFIETLEVGAEFKAPGKVLVELYDITGRKVFGNYYTISTAFFNKEIELGFLKAGVYSLAVTTATEKRTRLVVKR